MNRKGFTLIELLAVIVVMAVVLVLAFSAGLDSYKEGKLKAEDAFVKRLSQMVDNYVTLNSDELSFTSYQNGAEFAKPNQTERVTVSVAHITVNDLIEDKIIKKSDYINPNNKSVDCNTSAQIEIYKDSDSVYCHKVITSDLNCLTSEYIDKYLLESNNSEVINTCVWE